jgi:hypothetical protein
MKMKKVWIGSTRTGNLIQEVQYTNKTNFNVTIQGDDRGEVIVPLSTVPAQYTGKLNTFFKKNERFFAEIDDQGRVGFAGPIENITPNNNEAIVTNYCVGIALWLANVPCLPPANRERIDNQEATWTVTGTPAEIVRQVLAACLTESGNYAFPQSINPPVGGGGEVMSHTFILSEVISLKDFFDDLAASYEGFEVVFVPRLANPTKIVWDCNVGEPHFRKNEAAIDIDIDQRGGGVTAFSYNENGKANPNWWFVRSSATNDNDPNWIDLQSGVKPRPAGDEEYLTMFNKEFFSVSMTDAELASQKSARLTASETELKTYNISVFDENFDFVHKTGRRLQVTASKRLVGLDEELRLVGTSWIINDPSSVQTTVQPAALRIFPRVPNRMNDLVKDQASEQAKQDAWRNGTINPIGGGGTGGGVTLPPMDDWENPGSIQKSKDEIVIQSPITNISFLGNQDSFYAGRGEYAGNINTMSSPLWGRFEGYEGGNYRGNMGPDANTVVPNTSTNSFYGMGWGYTVLACDDNLRRLPPALEIRQSRKFNGFPEIGITGNGGSIWSDAGMKISGTASNVGQLTSLDIQGQMMSDDGPGVLKYEKLSAGFFFIGVGDQQKIVVYIHQLQIYNDDKTFIRSKGWSYEQFVNQADGTLVGGWTVTPYPFEVDGQGDTFIPMTSQVSTHGTDNSRVSCVTPAGYPRYSRTDIDFPAIVDNTFWRKIGQGRYAIKDVTVTKNFKTGTVYQTSGLDVGVFQHSNGFGGGDDDGTKWNEAYQLLGIDDELWATNMSFSGYFSKVNMIDQPSATYFLKFVAKTKIDGNGKPGDWDKKSIQYGSARDQYKNITNDEGYKVMNAELLRINDIIFTGIFDYHAGEKEEDYLLGSIAGKVGGEAVRVMTGNLPTGGSSTFRIADNASGYTKGDVEWWPDFWDFKLSTDRVSGANDKNWYRLPESGFIFPLYNGSSSNNSAGEVIHGWSSMKGLTLGNVVVVPPETGSWVLGNSGSGWSGQWRWYKI